MARKNEKMKFTLGDTTDLKGIIRARKNRRKKELRKARRKRWIEEHGTGSVQGNTSADAEEHTLSE